MLTHLPPNLTLNPNPNPNLPRYIKNGGSMRQHRAAARALLREAREAIGKQSAERRREIRKVDEPWP